MQVITSVISSFAYCIYMLVFVSGAKIHSCIMLVYVASAIADSGWYCLGTEQFKAIVARSTVIKIINLICIFAFVRNQNDLTCYVLIMALCQMFSQLALWPAVLKDVQWIKPEWREVWKHFKPNFLLFIPALSVSIYSIMDKVMIGVIASKSDLAYYEYANKIVEIPNIIFGAMGTVMLSRMSHMVSKDKNKAECLIGYSIDLSCIIAIGSTFGIMAVVDELVAVYYGNEFMPCTNILKLLCIVIPIYAWTNVVRMQYIIPNNKDNVYIIATFMGAVVNLVVNFLLIPKLSSIGAAIGTILAQLMVMAIFNFYSNKDLPLLEYVKKNGYLLVAGIVMFGIIKTIQRYHSVSVIGLIIDVAVGIVVYLLCGALLIMYFQKTHFANAVIKQIRKNKGD